LEQIANPNIMVKSVIKNVSIAKIMSATRLENAEMGANLPNTEPSMEPFSNATSRALWAAKLKNVVPKLEYVTMDVKLIGWNLQQASYKIVVFQSVRTEPSTVPLVLQIVQELVLIKNVGKILVLA
jgi:hypothetical protein